MSSLQSLLARSVLSKCLTMKKTSTHTCLNKYIDTDTIVSIVKWKGKNSVNYSESRRNSKFKSNFITLSTSTSDMHTFTTHTYIRSYSYIQIFVFFILQLSPIALSDSVIISQSNTCSISNKEECKCDKIAYSECHYME